jgi:hypothetical protein
VEENTQILYKILEELEELNEYNFSLINNEKPVFIERKKSKYSLKWNK